MLVVIRGLGRPLSKATPWSTDIRMIGKPTLRSTPAMLSTRWFAFDWQAANVIGSVGPARDNDDHDGVIRPPFTGKKPFGRKSCLRHSVPEFASGFMQDKSRQSPLVPNDPFLRRNADSTRRRQCAAWPNELLQRSSAELVTRKTRDVLHAADGFAMRNLRGDMNHAKSRRRRASSLMSRVWVRSAKISVCPAMVESGRVNRLLGIGLDVAIISPASASSMHLS